MEAILSVIAVVLISMLINRFATVALSLTGMSREEARFQARAAMSGVGLTTHAPEDIVAHPVRRRIVFWLMVVGSAGIVTSVASLVLSFRGGSAGDRLSRAGVLVGALLLLWLISRTRPVDRGLTRAIGWVLAKRGFAARDYGTLMDLSGDYALAELQVREADWVTDRSLRDLRLRDEGVVVVGIHRAGAYVGAPKPETVLEPADTLVLYGRKSRIAELDRRGRGPGGDAAHARAIAEADSADETGTQRARPPRPGSARREGTIV
jgi:hypothetical protein